MKKNGYIRLTIYNMAGQALTTLVHGHKTAGKHTLKWNVANIPSGIYICKMETGKTMLMKKMMLMK